MRAFSFSELPTLAVANGATTPAPTYASQCFAWSSTLGRSVVWDGAAWQRLATYGETLRNTTDTLTGNLTVTGTLFANVVNATTGANFGGTVGIATASGSAVLNLTRASLGTGQTSVNLIGGTGSSNWQIFQQSGASDLGFYSSAFGNNVAQFFTDGHAQFYGPVAAVGQFKSAKTGGGSGAAFLAANSGGYAWNDPAAATDGKAWDFLVGGTYMFLRTVNDANTAATNIMTVTRSGTAVASIAFGAPTSIAGALTCANLAAGDITASRGDGTGAIYFGGNTRYLYSSGTAYFLNGADLYVNGVLNASDVRLKRDFAPIEDITDKLMTIEAFTFAHVDNDARCIGVSAQSVQQYFPEAVRANAEGHLAVAYGPLALAGLVDYVKHNEASLADLRAAMRALQGA